MLSPHRCARLRSVFSVAEPVCTVAAVTFHLAITAQVLVHPHSVRPISKVCSVASRAHPLDLGSGVDRSDAREILLTNDKDRDQG